MANAAILQRIQMSLRKPRSKDDRSEAGKNRAFTNLYWITLMSSESGGIYDGPDEPSEEMTTPSGRLVPAHPSCSFRHQGEPG
jgi:hypothetical protein